MEASSELDESTKSEEDSFCRLEMGTGADSLGKPVWCAFGGMLFSDFENGTFHVLKPLVK